MRRIRIHRLIPVGLLGVVFLAILVPGVVTLNIPRIIAGALGIGAVSLLGWITKEDSGIRRLMDEMIDAQGQQIGLLRKTIESQRREIEAQHEIIAEQRRVIDAQTVAINRIEGPETS